MEDSDCLCGRGFVADSGHLPRADVPENQVRTDVRRILHSPERQLHAASVICGIGFCLGVAVVWVSLPWVASGGGVLRVLVVLLQGGIGYPVVWFLLFGFIWLCVEKVVVGLAVDRFNQRFPKGAAERPVALATLRSLESSYKVAQKMLRSPRVLSPTGPASAPEPEIQAALDQLAGKQAAPSAVPADPSSLHLEPFPVSQGKKATHPPDGGPRSLIPLELSDRRDPAGPKPAAEAKPLFLPIETLDNPAEEGKPQQP
jgi:hypothetical protein